MGILNIIKNSLEETPSSDTVPQNDLFFDGAEPPLVIDIHSDASDTESTTEIHDANDFMGDASYSVIRNNNDQELFSFLSLPSSPSPPEMESQENSDFIVDVTRMASTIPENVTADEKKLVRRARDLSNKSRRSSMGKKKARRYENARQLALLAAEAEQNGYDGNDFMPYDSSFRFSQILEDKDLTNEILYSVLEDVDDFLNIDFGEGHSRKKKIEPPTIKRLSPAEAFNNLDSSQKSLFKRRNLPMGMVQYLDTCVFSFFNNDPSGTYISEPLTSYERMMLHSIAHYYKLNSFSFNSEDRFERLTKITNNFQFFKPPCLCLSQYLEEHLWKNSASGISSRRRRCKRKQH